MPSVFLLKGQLKLSRCKRGGIDLLMEFIRPVTVKDVSRIAEIIVTNYRVNFYPFFNNDSFYENPS